MDESVAVIRDVGTIAEKVIAEGDLSQLTSAERTEHYLRICETLGLNWRTRPLEYLKFQGKVILYARKDCTDQLRRLHHINLRILSREQVGDVYVVTVQATMPDGREDESTGAVYIKGVTGDNLANAYLRCETKAKRRATLSIAGLGYLDETEVDTLPKMTAPVTRLPEEGRQSLHEKTLKPVLSVSEGEPAAGDDDLRSAVMNAIMESLRTVPKDDKARRLQLMQEAFGCGWSGLKEQSVEQLQAGYRHLQELMNPALVEGEITDEDDVPDFPQPGATESPLGETISTEKPMQPSEDEVVTTAPPDAKNRTLTYATPEQIAALKKLAQKVGDDAYADVQDMLDHHIDGLPHEVYEVVRSRLEARKSADGLTRESPEVQAITNAVADYDAIRRDWEHELSGWTAPVSRAYFAQRERNYLSRIKRAKEKSGPDRVQQGQA